MSAAKGALSQVRLAFDHQPPDIKNTLQSEHFTGRVF